MTNVIRICNKLALLLAVLALTSVVAYGADTKTDGQITATPGPQQKKSAVTTTNSTAGQTTVKSPAPATTPGNNLKNLPYPTPNK
ncbi:MAG: hypothetical protein HQK97_04160 [Nitrospirae bacterium]|nr:hypothetical protein [Nitrospirota bacterium]